MSQAIVSEQSQSNPAGVPASTPASWGAVAAIGIGAFALVTAEFLPVGLLPQIAKDLSVSEGQAGLMVTIPGVFAACAALLTIGLAGRFDRRHVLWFLLSLLVVSNLLVASAASFDALLLGRVLLGVAVGGFWTIGGALGPRLRPEAAGKATAIIFSGVSLGTVAGVPAGALLGNLLGWRMAFGASAAVALLVVGALIWLLPVLRPARSTGLSQIPAVLKLRKVQVGLAAVVLIFIGQFAAYTYITPFLNQISGIEAGVLSAVLLAYGLSGFFGNVFCGWVVERDVRLAVLGTSLILGMSLLLLLFTGTNPWFAVVAVVVWGFGFGMLPIAIQSWIFSAAPDRLESVAALFVSIAQLAIGAGALIGGLAVDHFGVESALWVTLA
ncbi:putative MFS family arabinose efflux permease [Pseudomonas corrugata]|uniref:MFS transporter n=1 Tax=Pseudomonas corrugata TaxID=47879 RepID=UPI00285BF535|nr:MFS transporter [Pseudomonas corrugata]MDR7282951.1 putative MFS family arabinose efflux permease [Pseudomonas corrugata]